MRDQRSASVVGVVGAKNEVGGLRFGSVVGFWLRRREKRSGDGAVDSLGRMRRVVEAAGY